MPKPPADRRHRAKATVPSAPKPASRPAPSEPEHAGAQPPAPPAPSESLARRILLRGNVAWALATGLAVGFVIGRETHRFGLADSREGDPAESAFIAAEAPSVKAYAQMADFPAGWVKDSDLTNRAALLAGLTDAQKTTVMQALNERNCECGCTFGTLAQCLQKDPNCPRSPVITKLAVDLVKQGKGLGEILSAIDAKQKDMAGGKPQVAAPEAPSTPRKVELAAWNPRKGPKEAKVTLVEFSDFQ
jgi:hypothetical protein